MADRHLIDVHVLLVDEGDILLTQRRDTNPAFDGLWHLPSGKLDAGESAIAAAAREAEEEIGSSSTLPTFATCTPPTSTAPVQNHASVCSSKPDAGSANPPTANPTNAQPSAGSRLTRYQTSSSTTPPPAFTLTATA